MPENMPDRMPDRIPEDMPDRIPEDLPDRMSEDMPDRMPEDLPDRMPEDMPEDMSKHMPEDMPDRMPNRMPEDMSDRMPQDLPVRKYINVMVGIPRSKVIFGTPSSWNLGKNESKTSPFFLLVLVMPIFPLLFCLMKEILRFQSLQSKRFEAQRGLAEATPRT